MKNNPDRNGSTYLSQNLLVWKKRWKWRTSWVEHLYKLVSLRKSCLGLQMWKYSECMQNGQSLNSFFRYEPLCPGNLTRSDKNPAVQLLNMDRDWKFRLKKVGVLYYPSSENKNPDQFHGYREADLHFCFHTCKYLVFLWRIACLPWAINYF